MHVATSSAFLAVASFAVASFAAPAGAAPVSVTALATNATIAQCNVGCIPKGTAKKDGQHQCCTQGRSTFKCPGPSHYQCGPAAPALWFKRYADRYSTGLSIRDQNSCGEVNAAPYMGAYLFEPKNAAALAAYIKFTLAGTFGSSLLLGRCADPTSAFDPDDASLGGVAYTIPAKESGNLFWNNGFDMDGICRKQCDCSYTCDLVTCKDPCTDVPDAPKKGKFCSLCGPKYSTGMGSVYHVKAYTQANIVQLAQSVPTLSTLVAAVVAANLATTLSGTGLYGNQLTVFAPNDAAFAKLPAGLLAKLLKPENVRDLVNILELHVVAPSGNPRGKPALYLKDLKEMDGQTLKTINGLELTVTVKGGDVYLGSGFTAASKIIAGDNPANNGAVHIIETVLIPANGPAPLSNQCNPDTGTCNVCKACCASYITSQENCDACVHQEC